MPVIFNPKDSLSFLLFRKINPSKPITAQADQVKNNIEKHFGQLDEEKSKFDLGPATYYRIKDAKGRIGFINPLTEFFCVDCNSLWLMADGRVCPCCHSTSYIDLKAPLRQREFKLLGEKIKDSLFVKPSVNRNSSFTNFHAS